MPSCATWAARSRSALIVVSLSCASATPGEPSTDLGAAGRSTAQAPSASSQGPGSGAAPAAAPTVASSAAGAAGSAPAGAGHAAAGDDKSSTDRAESGAAAGSAANVAPASPPQADGGNLGTALYSADDHGQGACAGTTVGDVIAAIHAAHSEVAGIQQIRQRELSGGSDLIYAFARPDGSFALIFTHGEGDCLAGCIANEYWYFETRADCVPVQVGHYTRDASGPCVQQSGEPMWGLPQPLDPINACNTSSKPAALSGTYRFRGKGQRMPCATSATVANTQPESVDVMLEIVLTQDTANSALGTALVRGTGHKLIDERVLPTQFTRQRFSAREARDNLPSMCIDMSSLEVSFDFEGFGSHELRLDEVHTPNCAGAPDDYCKGYVELDLTQLK